MGVHGGHSGGSMGGTQGVHRGHSWGSRKWATSQFNVFQIDRNDVLIKASYL